MLEFLTQQSHPRLWLAFQATFGATRDKRDIALSFLQDRERVLEIGCSLGVVAEAFRDRTSVRYLGIDIDEQAIRQVRERFESSPHMEFLAQSLQDLVRQGRRFDYVLFANILHHVDDEMASNLLRQAAAAVDTNGIIVLMEPDVLHARDGWLVRFLYRLERGQYRRPIQELVRLATDAGIRLARAETRDISIGLLPGFVGGHMLVLSGSV